MRILSVWVLELADGDVTRSMAECPSAIKWCVYITIRPAGDIYSPTHVHVHTHALCMKDRVTARTNGEGIGSGMLAKFDPRPNESQQFRMPNFGLEG